MSSLQASSPIMANEASSERLFPRPSYSRLLSSAALAWLFAILPNGKLICGLMSEGVDLLYRLPGFNNVSPLNTLKSVFK